MKLISALVALVLLAIPCQAKVLIYKGTLKRVAAAPPATSLPTVSNIYLLVDPDNSVGRDLIYFTKDGKHQNKNFPGANYITSAPAPAGKTLTVMTNGNATFDDATHFTEGFFLVFGVNDTLKFTTLTGEQTINFPKSFAGTESVAANNGGTGRFEQYKYILSYQSKATIAANDAGRSLAEVADDLSAALLKQGYQPGM